MKRNTKTRSRKPKSGKCQNHDHDCMADEAIAYGSQLSAAVLRSLAAQVPDLGVQIAAVAETVAMLTASVARSTQLMHPTALAAFMELLNTRLAGHFQNAKVDVTLVLRH